MSFLKNIFGSKPEKPEEDPEIFTNQEFWEWFQSKSEKFWNIVKSGEDIEEGFFIPLSNKLGELREEYYFLTGMSDPETAELVLTADGNIKNIHFVEQLVKDAPEIANWKITALKDPMSEEASIVMEDVKFEVAGMSFYPHILPDYPDEVAITLIHPDYNEEQKTLYTNGAFILMDNYLGELKAATQVDYAEVSGPVTDEEMIPITKLGEYLNWREKEFVEQYQGLRYNTENDNYMAFEATLNDGSPLIATMNGDLLKWDKKASHPWMTTISFGYESGNENGFPQKTDYEMLNDLEDELFESLKDSDGYLNIGRETADGSRVLFIASKEFRNISKVITDFQSRHADKFEITYKIFKDKYWRSLNFYTQPPSSE